MAAPSSAGQIHGRAGCHSPSHIPAAIPPTNPKEATINVVSSFMFRLPFWREPEETGLSMRNSLLPAARSCPTRRRQAAIGYFMSSTWDAFAPIQQIE